jgi:hypothetical protein
MRIINSHEKEGIMNLPKVNDKCSKAFESTLEKKKIAENIANNTLFKKSMLGTDKYYFYFTEIWKDKNRPS